jgi:hypothetical protein
MLRGAPRFLGAFWALLAWGPLAQANEPEVQVVGERAPRASAAAADATLAAERAERAAAAQAVAGRARHPSLHAFVARTTSAAPDLAVARMGRAATDSAAVAGKKRAGVRVCGATRSHGGVRKRFTGEFRKQKYRLASGATGCAAPLMVAGCPSPERRHAGGADGRDPGRAHAGASRPHRRRRKRERQRARDRWRLACMRMACMSTCE